jgi:hypothetical protein
VLRACGQVQQDRKHRHGPDDHCAGRQVGQHGRDPCSPRTLTCRPGTSAPQRRESGRCRTELEPDRTLDDPAPLRLRSHSASACDEAR